MTEQLSPAERRQLDRDGFLVLDGFMEPPLLAALRVRVEQLYAAEGERAGAEFKQESGCRRLANLADKGDLFLGLMTRPRLLACVGHVLGPEFKLSSLNARSANPHTDCRQPLHADMGGVPDARGPWVCNSVWMLDEFTAENGAIRVVPGSHRTGQLPADALPDPLAPHPDELLLTAPAGTVVVMNAHLWHGATANRSAAPRRAVHVFFGRRDKPQQQYQKRLLRPELQRSLTPQQRQLLALDDAENDRLCAEASGQSGFLK